MYLREVTIHVVMTYPYIVLIQIYGTNMTIYLERENINVLGLVSHVGKRGCFPTFIVHLGLMGMGVALPPCFGT